MLGVHGDKATNWIASFDKNLEEFCHRHSLDIKTISPFKNLSYHFVASIFSQQQNQSVVLKAGYPSESFIRENKLIKKYPDSISPQVVATDWTTGFVLIERLQPGTLLAEIEDDAAATQIALKLISHYQLPSSDEYPSVLSWSQSFDQYLASDNETSSLTAADVAKAKSVFSSAKSYPWRLLHGDFHNQNILAVGESNWKSIDPKGINGPAFFECLPYLRNMPFSAEEKNWKLIFEHRLTQFAESYMIEREVLKNWSLAEQILSQCWSVEDSKDDGQKSLEKTDSWKLFQILK